jgi:predicted transcriptional regulator
MVAKVRMNIEVSQDVADLLEQLSREEATTKTEIVRRALSVLKAYKQQKQKGRAHLGFTSDPTKLDAEMLGVLDSQ